ncbi:MAG: hypothetical protein ACK4G3_03290, partial [bacterium]
FRAVENGCSQIRITLNGYSQVVNPRGKILYSRHSFTTPRICEVVRVPVQTRRTLYPLSSDLFAMINLVALFYFLSVSLGK